MSGAGGEVVAEKKPLWTLAEVISATGAENSPRLPDIDARVTGVSIDTRTLESGNLFVALKDVRDGHDFVKAAFDKGAAAALVKRDFDPDNADPRLLRVDYPAVGISTEEAPLEALRRLGREARNRLSDEARVIAVTGSAGKTTTKEMLRACLTPLGKTHASEKSYNNHWGVPLTLARMPADTQFAVFEIGMNHAGEITPLTKMVRPHLAIVTTVAAVHLEHFATVEKIAEAKAEIFAGLESSGTAIIPADNPYTKILVDEAEALGARVVTFGTIAAADFRRSGVEHGQSGTGFTARGNAPELGVFEFAVRLETFGQHMVRNALAVAAALTSIDQKPATAMIPLANFKAPGGRGSRTKMAVNGGNVLVIDESYNANPASMRAALETTALTSRATHPRRIAVLGDMLELGEQSESLHKALAEPIEQAGVDLVFAAGPNMKHLYDVLPLAKRAKDGWAPTAAGIEAALLATVRAGDVVMIKGSNGSRMAPLVAALIARHTPATVST